jgi:hypothetical protein
MEKTPAIDTDSAGLHRLRRMFRAIGFDLSVAGMARGDGCLSVYQATLRCPLICGWLAAVPGSYRRAEAPSIDNDSAAALT